MLALDRSGAGIPLVLLHAFPLSRRMWEPNRAALTKNFELIRVDFPGFGETPLSAETTSMDVMADELEQTLQSQHITQKIILAGVSMGGYVAFRYLEKFAPRLRALALISTRSAPDTEAVRAKRQENIRLIETSGIAPFAERSVGGLLGKSIQESQPAAVATVKQWIKDANPLAVCAALRGLAGRPDSTLLLSGITVPTLVLSGAEDTIVPSTEMKAMAGQISRSEFQCVSSAGHLVTLEASSVFHELFLTFLKRRVL